MSSFLDIDQEFFNQDVPLSPTLITPTEVIDPEPFIASERLLQAIADARKQKAERSFSGRHPELGPMIKCAVCGTRHRKFGKFCEQKFVYFYTEEDLDTGETADVFRIVPLPNEKPTAKQLYGAFAFNKKRLHPHSNKKKLLLVQLVKETFAMGEYDIDNMATEEFQKLLRRVKRACARKIRKADRAFRHQAQKMQAESRRANHA